ncbi:thialysine N-epsilon-acetyltransferase-like isoform X2 [Malaclemys terrapin pileata]|uniref:thialysine N-epsilon-acetyltransferase-like isoform X4 n=1 Tax=Chrysemys picta bellii TaxID=8478 RepID=UPI000388D8BE|nr:thialysine N-epsilon-acetyltransferase-like isoform X4 [Chrysemys picta bellii]XP_053861430.1 thialysine N-epsilon-acetyltransferase-like isoform X2 [Malaclemys terrapin pileata]
MECVLRPCRAEDCAEVMRMIKELAEFEELPDQVQISDQVLREDGFANDPFYRCLVAEVPPEHRSQDGKGIGKKLMSKIAEIGVENRCTQLKFVVLDWNRTAIDFYQGQGAVDLTTAEGWHFFHVEGDALKQLAQGQLGH